MPHDKPKGLLKLYQINNKKGHTWHCKRALSIFANVPSVHVKIKQRDSKGLGRPLFMDSRDGCPWFGHCPKRLWQSFNSILWSKLHSLYCPLQAHGCLSSLPLSHLHVSTPSPTSNHYYTHRLNFNLILLFNFNVIFFFFFVINIASYEL